MSIVDELKHLQKLFVKNVRRLLHLLSTSTHKARVEVVALLQKYYNLLFGGTPTRVYKAMVDSNQWLTEVLSEAYSKGIERDLSYGENSSLALEEQLPHDRACHWAFDNTSTIQLLRAACEHYMDRCNSLQATNADLETQLVGLKAQLKEALFRAFKSQHDLEREWEVSALQARHLVMRVQSGNHLAREKMNDEHPLSLHQQITSAFSTLDTDSTASPENNEETSTDKPSETSLLEQDCKGKDALAQECVETRVATSDNQEEFLPLLPSEDAQVAPEAQEKLRLSAGRLESEPATSSVVAHKPISNSADVDYVQLTKLRSDEVNNGIWYRHALRTLREARKRRSKKCAAAAESPFSTKFTASAVCKEGKAQEFTQLVCTRDPAIDGEDPAWYSKALQHLKGTRKHHLSLHN